MSNTSIPVDLECPTDLCPKGKRAWKLITDYLIKNDLAYTGGCKAFFSPKAWREKGEEYGIKSYLVIVYDGGDVRECFDPHVGYKHAEAMSEILRKEGLYYELCTGWYAAIYGT